MSNHIIAERHCPECGHQMVRDTRPFTINYKGLSTTFPMPAWYCTHCAEAVATGADAKVSNREFHALKARAENLLLPSEVRRVRKKLGLTQSEAGAILGGGPNAFHKYESADVLPSQAISNLLRVLEANPDMLNVLRETAPVTANA